MAPLVSLPQASAQNRPGELVLELLRSSLSGLEIRRIWLQTLCEQFSATHALIENLSWNPSTEAMLFHDMCFWSEDPKWVALESVANTYSLADTEFEAEHLGESMMSTLVEETGQPAPMVELLWKPFQLGSGITLSVTKEGFLAGGVSIFRDKRARDQFTGSELHDQAAWEIATINLITSTYSMLGHGGAACGTYLFSEEGELWMENAVPQGDEGQCKSIQPIIKDFVASGQDNHVQSIALHSVHLSWLEGQDKRAILAVSQPLLVTKLSELYKLSVEERQVAQKAARGATIDEIAIAMDRSASTVKSHLENIYAFLDIECRAELARFYNGIWQYKP